MTYFEWLQLCCLIFLLSGPSSTRGSMIGGRVLRVGEELFKETLPLQNGVCIYQLQGLRPHMWYEVKISYPASVFCDELLLGIPHKAWYVVILVLLCLVFAFVVPSFLPSFLLPKNGNPTVTKRS
ncbi:hypothetical protein ACJIZ3_004894 [Penstemon smallii]|uniref:Uncharacterized protein n=1 Tax=Penstemon smallii TaxID=265156 RepID=A0ABD3S3D6_9LAMI